MEINKIFYFRTVYETENVREAASLIGMSPGALSKAIKSLEAELDKDLFVQKGRNIIPTDFARLFYNNSSDLITTFNKLINSTKGEKEREAPIRIASWEVFSSYFVAHLVKTEFPKEPIKVIERTPSDLEASILKGEADIGITYAPLPHKDLSILKVCSFEYRVFGLASKFRNYEHADLPFAVPITLFSSSPTGVKSLDCWPEEVERNEKFQFELLETSLELARQGLAVVHCPSFLIDLQNIKNGQLEEIQFLPKRRIVKQSIYLVTRKSMDETREVKKIARALRRLGSK